MKHQTLESVIEKINRNPNITELGFKAKNRYYADTIKQWIRTEFKERLRNELILSGYSKTTTDDDIDRSDVEIILERFEKALKDKDE